MQKKWRQNTRPPPPKKDAVVYSGAHRPPSCLESRLSLTVRESPETTSGISRPPHRGAVSEQRPTQPPRRLPDPSQLLTPPTATRAMMRIRATAEPRVAQPSQSEASQWNARPLRMFPGETFRAKCDSRKRKQQVGGEEVGSHARRCKASLGVRKPKAGGIKPWLKTTAKYDRCVLDCGSVKSVLGKGGECTTQCKSYK